jgi:lipid-A-disaccharide synthase
MGDFGEAVARLASEQGPLDVVLPTLPHVESEVRAHAALWAVKPRIEIGEAAKLATFRAARAALAASGTVTLELALAGVPMVGAYKVSRLEEQLKYVIKLPHSVLLPNLILGERAIPEMLQQDCTPDGLATALAGLVGDGPARQAQVAALAKLDALMRLPEGDAPSERAARETLATIARR